MQKFGLVFADAGLGVLATLFICWLFSVPLTISYIVVGIVFAYIPDIDLALDKHFWKTGHAAAYSGNPYDHREGLHKPLLWALLISAWGLVFGGLYPFIALVAVTLHFLHDTVGTGWGMPWLWPLTKRRFKFFATKENVLTLQSPFVSWSYEELPSFIVKYGRSNWKELCYGSWTGIAIAECALALGALLAFVAVAVL